MAISGVPWGASIDEISEAIKECRGLVSYAAKKLGVAHFTLYRHIKESTKLQQCVKDAREAYVEERCDNAERVLEECKKLVGTDSSVALKASMYTLNNLGRDRSYCHAEVAKADLERGLVDMIKDGTIKVTPDSKD